MKGKATMIKRLKSKSNRLIALLCASAMTTSIPMMGIGTEIDAQIAEIDAEISELMKQGIDNS